MAQFEMLQQAVQLEAIDGAPGAVEVPPRLCLLPAVVVVHELVEHELGGLGASDSWGGQDT